MIERSSTIGRLLASVLAVVALAGIQLIVTASASAAPLRWSAPELIDTAQSGEAFGALSCPSATLCVAPDADGGVATSTEPGTAAPWTITRLTPYPSLTTAPAIQSLSCPTVTLCVGTDTVGDIYTTTTPTGGADAWRQAELPGAEAASSIDCPTIGLCVITSSDSDQLFTSTDPTAGGRSWIPTTVTASNSSEAAVSCSSASFCAFGAGGGLIFTSTNPAGGGSTYVAHHALTAAAGHTAPDITAIVCPSATLCLAGDSAGDLLTSADPANADAVWSADRIDPGHGIAAIGCEPSGSCTAIDNTGVLFATSSAAAAPAMWSKVASDEPTAQFYGGTATFAVACPTDSLCLAVDGGPDMPRSTAPTVRGSWLISPPPSDIRAGFTGISCPSLRLCVAIDLDGNVVSTRTPEVSHSWRVAHIDQVDLTGISCPTRSFCVATDRLGDVFISTDPTGGSRAWRSHQIEDGEAGGNGPPTGLMGVSCVSAHFCMTGDENPGDVLTATDPWGPARAWTHHGPDGPGDGLVSVSCPSVAFCGVADASGAIDAFTPAGSAHFTDVSVADGVDAIACPSSRLCVATAGGENDQGTGGGIWSSIDPASAHPRWRHVAPDGDEQLAIACHARSLCLAVDIDGRASVSVRPAARRPGWTMSTIDPGAVFTGVSCPTSRVCVVVDDNGYARIAERP